MDALSPFEVVFTYPTIVSAAECMPLESGRNPVNGCQRTINHENTVLLPPPPQKKHFPVIAVRLIVLLMCFMGSNHS